MGSHRENNIRLQDKNTVKCCFERELNAMGDIKHRNVVALRGYYNTPHDNILIYELMKNGSLDTILHRFLFRCRKLSK